MANDMRKLMTALMMPPSGTTKEASGVAHTTAEAATVMSRVAPKAIHQTLRPRRWRPRDFQPSLEYFPGVAIPGDDEQRDQGRHGRSARPQAPHSQARRK